jgi:Leucine-rich repeat (LRR) protein
MVRSLQIGIVAFLGVLLGSLTATVHADDVSQMPAWIRAIAESVSIDQKTGQVWSFSLKLNKLSNDDLGRLREYPQLSYLHFDGEKAKDVDLTKGFQSLSELKELRSLTFNRAGSVSAKEFATFHGIRKLRSIRLYGANLTPEVIGAIAKITQLQVLDVLWSTADDNALPQLAKLVNLRQLLLDCENLTDEGLGCLAGMKRLRILRIFTPQNPRIAPDRSGIQSKFTGGKVTGSALRHLRGCKDLRKLIICYHPLTDESLKHIGACSSLRELDLGSTPVSSKGVAHLTSLTRLRKLVLSETSVDNEGIKQLATLKKLQGLDLSFVQGVNNDTLKLLCPFKEIVSLDLSFTNIDDEGIPDLIELGKLKHLRYFHVSETKITEKGRRVLKRAVPQISPF